MSLVLNPALTHRPLSTSREPSLLRPKSRIPTAPILVAAVAIPVPWDAKYQENFVAADARLGERYSSDPYV